MWTGIKKIFCRHFYVSFLVLTSTKDEKIEVDSPP